MNTNATRLEPLDNINWPTDRKIIKDGVSYTRTNDLESLAGIPGTNYVLFCESGNSREDDPVTDRIYFAEVNIKGDGGSVTIKSHTSFSTFTEVYNVEASAVAATDSGYLFFWAERSESTIKWAPLTLQQDGDGYSGVSIHATGGGEGAFSLNGTIEQSGNWRPVIALDVDPVSGHIFSAASQDREDLVGPGADADNGPYNSVTFVIGQVNKSGNVRIFPKPQLVQQHFGFKVESVARADEIPGMFNTIAPATFIGTDDENYYSAFRKLAYDDVKGLDEFKEMYGDVL